MRVLIIVLALLFTACSGVEKGHYIIEGKSYDEGSYYYLFRADKMVDSALVTNGQYRFEGIVEEQLPIRNISSTSLRDPFVPARFTQVILEDSGIIKVCEDDNSPTGKLKVTGTKANNALYNFSTEATRYHEAMRSCADREKRAEYMSKYIELVKQTVYDNLDNFAGVFMFTLSSTRFTEQEREDILKRVSPKMQKTEAIKQLTRKEQTLKSMRQLKNTKIEEAETKENIKK